MKKKPYWRNSKVWMCPNHLPSAKIPASCPECWFSNCKSTRPATLEFVNSPPLNRKNRCFWRDCDKGSNGNPANSRERSKYCSTDCKNRNARWRYKMKKKGLLKPAA